MSRSRGIFSRMRRLLRGVFSSWVQDRERANPRVVYEQVIHERTKQYAELKQAVAGILYMRNKLDGEITERTRELARTRDHIQRAVERGDDDVALVLIAQKDALVEDLERAQRELGEVVNEAEGAKSNLVKFRSEIKALEREKVRMMATLASARARRRIQEAFEGLSLESDMRALENVRSQVASMAMEGRLDRELGEADPSLKLRVQSIREEARTEGARKELAELKRHLRPQKPDLLAPTAPAVIDAEPATQVVSG